MRRNDREISDNEKMYSILDKATLLNLGLFDGEEPYVVPLDFVRVGDALYFHCATEGKKLDIIANRPGVCFAVTGETRHKTGDAPCDCSTFYESVIGWGTAAVLNSVQEKSTALAALNKKFGAPEGPFPPAMLDAVAVVRIGIERMTGKAKHGKM
ncbi:MAG: pyridoxamine 5'-phosphate oxidase family protein [Treponemataceae bacterium]